MINLSGQKHFRQCLYGYRSLSIAIDAMREKKTERIKDRLIALELHVDATLLRYEIDFVFVFISDYYILRRRKRRRIVRS